MQLSAEQLLEILEHCKPEKAKADSDGRRAQRVEQRVSTHIRPSADRNAGRIAVDVRDFSTRGVCVLNLRPMDVGAQFVIEFPRRNRAPVEFLCTVAHCQTLRPDLFAIGAEFTCRLPDRPQTETSTEEQVNRIRHSILD